MGGIRPARGGLLGPHQLHQGKKPSDTAGGTIAFEVEDLDRLITDLKGKGVIFKSDVIHSPVCRMAVCLDSEGNSILLHRGEPERHVTLPEGWARPNEEPSVNARREADQGNQRHDDRNDKECYSAEKR
jgi:hypothetical protein